MHRITKERPIDRFVLEREQLKPLREYDVMLEESRVANAYALVSVDGVQYSVPPQLARQPLTLQRRPESLSFVVDGATVARHDYAAKGQCLVQDPAHLPPPPKPRHERFAPLGEAVVAACGDAGRRYFEAVESKAPHAPLALLREVLERCDEFGATTVMHALESAPQQRSR